VIDGGRRLLAGHPSVHAHSVRVQFLRLGTHSLDLDVFAYVATTEWSHYLEVQDQLLFGLAGVVEAAGAKFAFQPPATAGRLQ
jgi:MscS family membrane protein